LEPSEDLLQIIQKKGALTRVLDHGDSSPTCCLWFAAIGGVFICYREYYCPNQPISYHRRAIAELSGDERYTSNFADPQIFKKSSQKDGGFWTTADEYLDTQLSAFGTNGGVVNSCPPLAWIPADNNEFATRNRINELLAARNTHITGARNLNLVAPDTSSAPALYFIKKTPSYQNGCFHAISELQSQRRKSLGYIDGKQIFCDDREESIADHAYDCIRYYVASHGRSRQEPRREPPPHSFKWYKHLVERARHRSAVALSN